MEQSRSRPGVEVRGVEPIHLDRAVLLLRWLRARRALEEALEPLLVHGPAAEDRVSARLELVQRLEETSRLAFDDYRAAVQAPAGAASQRVWQLFGPPPQPEPRD